LTSQITGRHTLWSFLWGYVKVWMYETPVAGINYLKNRIHTAISAPEVDIPQRTWLELE
jgi:hypothetical protein